MGVSFHISFHFKKLSLLGLITSLTALFLIPLQKHIQKPIDKFMISFQEWCKNKDVLYTENMLWDRFKNVLQRLNLLDDPRRIKAELNPYLSPTLPPEAEAEAKRLEKTLTDRMWEIGVPAELGGMAGWSVYMAWDLLKFHGINMGQYTTQVGISILAAVIMALAVRGIIKSPKMFD